MDKCRSMILRIFVLLSVLLPCDSEERMNLTAVVGSTLTFPDPVKERGFLSFGPTTIASVIKGVFEIENNLYSNRLQWSSSGHFTLSDLQKTDSGVYTIDSKKPTEFSKVYEVRIYEPVSAPVVSCVNVSRDSLSLHCSANKTEQSTLSWVREDQPVSKLSWFREDQPVSKLSWFREDQPVDISHSGVLSLTVPQQDYSLVYKCVAETPAEKKTITVNISTLCNIRQTQSAGDSSGTPEYANILIPILVSLAVLFICLGIYVKIKGCKKEPAAFQTQDSVQYAQINHHERNGNQAQIASTPAGSSTRPDLNTVYDQIQLRRMTPVYSNCGGEII